MISYMSGKKILSPPWFQAVVPQPTASGKEPNGRGVIDVLKAQLDVCFSISDLQSVIVESNLWLCVGIGAGDWSGDCQKHS